MWWVGGGSRRGSTGRGGEGVCLCGREKEGLAVLHRHIDVHLDISHPPKLQFLVTYVSLMQTTFKNYSDLWRDFSLHLKFETRLHHCRPKMKQYINFGADFSTCVIFVSKSFINIVATFGVAR